MASSPAGLCRSLLLIVLSSVLLEAAADDDYKSAPAPVFKDGRFIFGDRVENLPHGSNVADAPSAAAAARTHQEFSNMEWNFDASGQALGVAVEKNFNGASLGQVISDVPDRPSISPSSDVAQETEQAAEDAATAEDDDASQLELDTQYGIGDGLFQSSLLNPDVSNLGVFVSPRPVIPSRVLFNQPTCQTSDGTQGVCYVNQISCRLRGASYSHQCEDNNGACCVSQHGCNAVTRERISYYQNPDFPFNNTGNLICNFKVTIAPKVCAVRVDFLEYSTPITAICSETQLVFLIGKDTRTIPNCGVLTGVSMLFELKPSNGNELVISHVLGGKKPYSFNLRITQVPCTAVKPIQENVCGLRNNGLVRHKRDARFPSGSAASRSDGDSETPLELELEDDLSTGGQLATRILGGREAVINEWPWQVAMFKRPSKTSNKVRFFCGATLISNEYLLTAAHCVSRFSGFNHTDPREHLFAAIGDHNLRLRNESMVAYRTVKRIVIHPLYDNSRNSHDIALLQLSRPVSYSRSIAPACLSGDPSLMVGKDVHISGWGIVSFNGSLRGPTSAVLKTATVKVLSREVCEEKWKKFDNPLTVYRDLPPISERQGCADNTPGAACFGDSGGPVTFRQEDGRFALVGVVSFGPPLCQVGGNFPTVYTRISSYMSWIQLAVLDMF